MRFRNFYDDPDNTINGNYFSAEDCLCIGVYEGKETRTKVLICLVRVKLPYLTKFISVKHRFPPYHEPNYTFITEWINCEGRNL